MSDTIKFPPPKDRARHPAIELAESIAGFERQFPGKPEAQIEVPSETWYEWVRLAESTIKSVKSN